MLMAETATKMGWGGGRKRKRQGFRGQIPLALRVFSDAHLSQPLMDTHGLYYVFFLEIHPLLRQKPETTGGMLLFSEQGFQGTSSHRLSSPGGTQRRTGSAGNSPIHGTRNPVGKQVLLWEVALV